MSKNGRCINTTRVKTFGDRIDHTLYDLKMYFSENREMFMKNAYSKPKTKDRESVV